MLILILNIIGTIAFSISGAMKGLKHNLDILGVLVLGIITAVGGGIIRDVLLNKTPAVLQDEKIVYYAIVAAVLTYIVGQNIENVVPYVKEFDAAGLAVFTVIGASRGIEAGLGIFGITVMGTLTGVAGGMIRDILVKEIPFVLKEDVYAVFCVAGAFLCWLLWKELGIPKTITFYIVIIFVFVGRLIAMKYNLHLPRRINKNKRMSD